MNTEYEISITPKVAFIDEKVEINISGFKENEKVTLRA